MLLNIFSLKLFSKRSAFVYLGILVFFNGHIESSWGYGEIVTTTTVTITTTTSRTTTTSTTTTMPRITPTPSCGYDPTYFCRASDVLSFDGYISRETYDIVLPGNYKQTLSRNITVLPGSDLLITAAFGSASYYDYSDNYRVEIGGVIPMSPSSLYSSPIFPNFLYDAKAPSEPGTYKMTYQLYYLPTRAGCPAPSLVGEKCEVVINVVNPPPPTTTTTTTSTSTTVKPTTTTTTIRRKGTTTNTTSTTVRTTSTTTTKPTIPKVVLTTTTTTKSPRKSRTSGSGGVSQSAPLPMPVLPASMD